MPKKKLITVTVLAVLALAMAVTSSEAAVITAYPPPGSAYSGTPGADPLILFTFSATGVSGSALLNTVDNGNGTFTATSGSGTFNGVAVTLIPNVNVPPAWSYSPLNLFYYDNVLYRGSNPVLDAGGLMFSAPGVSPFDGLSNVTEINIFSNGPGSYQYYEGGPGGYGHTEAFSRSRCRSPAC